MHHPDTDDNDQQGDYWYTRRNELNPGQVFRMYDGSVVRLVGRTEGDGTKWDVDEWSNGWFISSNEIEPGDLRGQPIEDTPAAIATVVKAEA